MDVEVAEQRNEFTLLYQFLASRTDPKGNPIVFSLGEAEVMDKGWIRFQYLPNADKIYTATSTGFPVHHRS